MRLDLLGNDQLVDAEVGGAVVELDLGVLGRAGRLLVSREKRILERGELLLSSDEHR